MVIVNMLTGIFMVTIMMKVKSTSSWRKGADDKSWNSASDQFDQSVQSAQDDFFLSMFWTQKSTLNVYHHDEKGNVDEKAEHDYMRSCINMMIIM